MGHGSGQGPGSVFRRPSVAEDVDRELEAHVALRAQELTEQGWEPSAAREEAERLLGDRPRIRREAEEVVRSHQRSERRTRALDGLFQDLRYGLRTLLGSPTFAAVAAITLTLGIGANAAIFSVVRGVLLAPLPWPDAGALVAVHEVAVDGHEMSVAWPNLVDWREQSTSFEGLFGFGSSAETVVGGSAPTTAQVASITDGAWSVLGAAPVRGRLTDGRDHLPEAPPVLVVSEGFWNGPLGRRPLGELTLEVSGLRAPVVGVVPDRLAFPRGTEVWYAGELFPQSPDRSAHNWDVVGRLVDAVPVERATAELDDLTRRLVATVPGEDRDFLAAGARAVPLHDEMVGGARPPLLMLLGAAGLVLLVACINLASTLLARGTNRARELALRTALGAGRGRVVRQLVTESAVLAVFGALLGLLLGAAIVEVLIRLGPASIPRLDTVGVDWAVMLYTAGAAGLTVLLAGLAPALRLVRGEAADVLRTGGRGSSGGARRGTWSLLVGSEVALALVLLVGSALLIRSFRTLLTEEVGVHAADVLAAPIALSNVRYETPEAHAAWYGATLEAVAALPGVSAAGLISALPVSGFLPSGRLELDDDLSSEAEGGYVVASAGAFEALDIPLLQGRLFDRTDTPDQPHVAIVSASFARTWWPGESAVGRSVSGGGMDNFWQTREFAQVVGVVGDVRFRSLDAEPIPTVYFPYTQRPQRIRYNAAVVVEAAAGAPGSVAGPVRATLERMDPEIPLELARLSTLVGASEEARRFTMLLLTGFSLVALLLAVVGIYGVVS